MIGALVMFVVGCPSDSWRDIVGRRTLEVAGDTWKSRGGGRRMAAAAWRVLCCGGEAAVEVAERLGMGEIEAITGWNIHTLYFTRRTLWH